MTKIVEIKHVCERCGITYPCKKGMKKSRLPLSWTGFHPRDWKRIDRYRMCPDCQSAFDQEFMKNGKKELVTVKQ